MSKLVRNAFRSEFIPTLRTWAWEADYNLRFFASIVLFLADWAGLVEVAGRDGSNGL